MKPLISSRPLGTPSRPYARSGLGTGFIGLVALSLPLSPSTALGQSVDQVARSELGMVVAAQPLAATAGARMLELGGNAADASVAAAFAISVVEPSMNSIGGRNQILIRTAEGRIAGIDGTTTVPLGYDPATATSATYGYATIGVPGTVAGLLRLHSEYGSLPLTTVMGPAIDYAEHGFRLLPGEARREATADVQIAESEGAQRYYRKGDGTSYGPGELHVQRDMAETLKAIAVGGRDAFYTGEIAHEIAADMADNGGYVTLEALAAYRAEDSRIVRGTYRGYEVVGSGIPASGSTAILALQIAENFDPDAMSDEAWAAVLGQSLALALEEYRRPDSDSAAARITSKAWARRLSERVRVPETAAGTGAGLAAAPGSGVGTVLAWGTAIGAEPASGATERAAAPGDGPATALGVAAGIDLPTGPGHTTHLSAADAGGMAVSLTQTLGPAMGSKVATPGLGFLYAVTLGGYLGLSEPGERARSGITPFMVLDDGQPMLVLGAAGGIRIPSAVIQAVSRVIDDGMSLPEALAAPRVHPDIDFEGGFSGFSVESGPDDGWSPESLTEFEALGFELKPTPRRGAFGRIHGLQYDAATGVWTGAADPDWEGAAVAPRGRVRPE